MHTTTFARMYPLAGGGNIIDTPGIKGFGLVDIEPGEVFRYFPESMRHSPTANTTTARIRTNPAVQSPLP